MTPTLPKGDDSKLGETTIIDEDEVDALLRVQADCLERAEKALVNFGKDGPTRKKSQSY